MGAKSLAYLSVINIESYFIERGLIIEFKTGEFLENSRVQMYFAQAILNLRFNFSRTQRETSLFPVYHLSWLYIQIYERMQHQFTG
jgi:hypothetical protein